MAAVIGRIFPYRALAAILTAPMDGGDMAASSIHDLDGQLQALQQQGMIRERAPLPEGEYIFKHQLTQEAAYNGLLKKERCVFHRRVAEALERLFPEGMEEMVALLARHWLRAGEEARALPYLQRAGDEARVLYAHAEAERFYRQAVRILRSQGQEESAARTLMKLGLVYTAAFEPAKAREAYDAAFALWVPLRESAGSPAMQSSTAVLRLAIEEPLTLDPAMVRTDVCAFMATQLFEGLVRVGQDQNVLPAAAARWEVEDAGTRYVFHLREGLCWNDGSPLTAADFAFAWRRSLSPATGSPVAHLLYAIRNARPYGEGKIDDAEAVGVTALNELTLEVRLEAPTAYLPHLLAHTVAYPLTPRAVDSHGAAWTENGNLISNGAYELLAWERGERLILRRNRFYRGPFPGNAERVECQVYDSYEPALEAYSADGVDALSLLNADPGTVARAQAAFGREVVSIPRSVTFYLAFRVDRPPFDNPRVRQAFACAVDRVALAEECFRGQRLPATGGFVPPSMPGHSPGIGLAYDPDLARRLMGEAGYPAGQGFPAVTLVYSGGSQGERVVSHLLSAWREYLCVGLDALSLDWAAFVERRARDPAELTLSGWGAGYPDPDNFLRVVFHSTEGSNYPRWRNAHFDALVEEATWVTDQAERMELYRQADRMLVAEEAVILPLSYGCGRMLVKPWVTLPKDPAIPVRLQTVVMEPREY
jgi:oligopeptide transport system substrate-binding protein